MAAPFAKVALVPRDRRFDGGQNRCGRQAELSLDPENRARAALPTAWALP